MKTTSSFRIKKLYKRVAATIKDPHKRGEYLRSMIEAQLHEEAAERQTLKQKDKE